MRIKILGVGNLLLKDEGVGVHIAQVLQRMPLPEGVEVIDSGTLADVVYLVESFDRLIIVDAAQGGDRPGTIYRFTLQDILPKDSSIFSSHEIDLFQSLLAMGSEERLQEVVIIGVEPKEVSWGLELSPEVERKLGEVCEVVLKECGEVSKGAEYRLGG